MMKIRTVGLTATVVSVICAGAIAQTESPLSTPPNPNRQELLQQYCDVFQAALPAWTQKQLEKRAVEGADYDIALNDMDPWIEYEAKRANASNKWQGIIPGLCTSLGHPMCTTDLNCKKGVFYDRPRWDAARYICTSFRANLNENKAELYDLLYNTYIEMDTTVAAMPAWEKIIGDVAYDDAIASEKVVSPLEAALATPCGILMGAERQEEVVPEVEEIEEDPSAGGPFMIR